MPRQVLHATAAIAAIEGHASGIGVARPASAPAIVLHYAAAGLQAAAAELEAWERLTYNQQQRRGLQWEAEGGRAAVNRPRYCRKCKAWKPPRAHHDSMTGRCVLRMDHYCMWAPRVAPALLQLGTPVLPICHIWLGLLLGVDAT
jgi:hypothetical protein